MIEILLALVLIVFLNGFEIVGFYDACQFTFHPQGKKNEDGANKYGVMNDNKMIFWWVKYISQKKLGMFWSKPICNCVSCMGSLHGVIPYTLFCLYYNPILLFLFPLYACVVGAMAKLIQSKMY